MYYSNMSLHCKECFDLLPLDFKNDKKINVRQMNLIKTSFDFVTF